MVGTLASKMLGVPFGIVDLSLAPTPAIGDSVAYILEGMGLEKCGTHGTTAALALLNDAVKRWSNGIITCRRLVGAFIPVSEDAGMIAAAQSGALSLEKLEAMTAVCSVAGLDMVVVPGEISADTISAIIADEAAIGMVNNKTTAVRLIPAIGKSEGDMLEFGGLLGSGPVKCQ